MNDTLRTIRHDADLHLEAYRFCGIVQPFPDHFHDYYVIGLVESGQRALTWRNEVRSIRPGDILLFNPGDSHGCTQESSAPFAYRAFNLPPDTLSALFPGLAEQPGLPRFQTSVVRDDDLSRQFQTLHQLVMDGGSPLEKGEQLCRLLADLLTDYSQIALPPDPPTPAAIDAARRYMEDHCGDRITLEQLCRRSGLSKSSLLRGFVRETGVTPYRYLQSIRIGRAKELLRRGATPSEAALQSGFADQSHLTHAFHNYIGLSPAAYRRVCATAREETRLGTP